MGASLDVGAKASLAKTCTDADLVLFSAVSLDTNPMHVDEVYASSTRFRRRIAHGMWAAGLISATLGTRLPGPGSIYLSQTLRFVAPVFVGDTVTATVEVLEVLPNGRVRMGTTCTNQGGTEVVAGEALILLP
jgi:3-hydroxybutyryl-CoA dehydratase